MSLYEHLTKLDNTTYPATDVIKSLIEILSQELCASNIRRGSHTFCAFISRSRDLCDHINFLIKKSIDEDGWTSYDEYTAMIEPLETYVLLSMSLNLVLTGRPAFFYLFPKLQTLLVLKP